MGNKIPGWGHYRPPKQSQRPHYPRFLLPSFSLQPLLEICIYSSFQPLLGYLLQSPGSAVNTYSNSQPQPGIFSLASARYIWTNPQPLQDIYPSLRPLLELFTPVSSLIPFSSLCWNSYSSPLPLLEIFTPIPSICWNIFSSPQPLLECFTPVPSLWWKYLLHFPASTRKYSSRQPPLERFTPFSSIHWNIYSSPQPQREIFSPVPSLC